MIFYLLVVLPIKDNLKKKKKKKKKKQPKYKDIVTPL